MIASKSEFEAFRLESGKSPSFAIFRYFKKFLKCLNQLKWRILLSVMLLRGQDMCFKKHSFISQVDDPLGEFSRVLENVLHVEDIRSYIHYKFESIGDNAIHKDLDLVCQGDLSLKQEFA